MDISSLTCSPPLPQVIGEEGEGLIERTPQRKIEKETRTESKGMKRPNKLQGKEKDKGRDDMKARRGGSGTWEKMKEAREVK